MHGSRVITAAMLCSVYVVYSAFARNASSIHTLVLKTVEVCENFTFFLEDEMDDDELSTKVATVDDMVDFRAFLEARQARYHTYLNEEVVETRTRQWRQRELHLNKRRKTTVDVP
jgi:hypothetical protein